jgi:phosphoribosylanthranilate isomerase
MKIKVCGMTDRDNVNAIVAARPDYLGFIFYENSPRSVDEAVIHDTIQSVPDEIDKVGVFVNEEIDKVLDIYRSYDLDYVQLHGDETEEYCAELKDEGAQIIKAFRIGTNFRFNRIFNYIPFIDLFLFDTKGDKRGGTGKKFDWKLLEGYAGDLPFLLSGGIAMSDIDAILKLGHPKLNGVDINSRFESAPGVKDVTSVLQFITKLRNEV